METAPHARMTPTDETVNGMAATVPRTRAELRRLIPRGYNVDSDRCLFMCRLVDGIASPVYSADTVSAWYERMPPLRVGALFDLIRVKKTYFSFYACARSR